MLNGTRAVWAHRLRTTAWTRGMRGSRGWLALATAMQAGRILRRLSRTEPEVLYRHVLVPGERYEVSASPPAPTRRQRRKAARSLKRSDRRRARKAQRRAGDR